jgi:hypothetical protein
MVDLRSPVLLEVDPLILGDQNINTLPKAYETALSWLPLPLEGNYFLGSETQ